MTDVLYIIGRFVASIVMSESIRSLKYHKICSYGGGCKCFLLRRFYCFAFAANRYWFLVRLAGCY